MINKIRQIIKPKYETLNRIEISRKAILDNYCLLKSQQPQAAIFPVLKSNAYGHGLKELCQILNDSKAPFVVVDSFPESQVTNRYFKKKTLILGEMSDKAYSYADFKKNEFCIYTKKSLAVLAGLGRARIHLFINSGMNREGIKDLKKFLTENRELLKKVEITGFCSHLAASEDDGAFNKKQLDKFLADLKILRSEGFNPKWIHLGNSAAIFTFSVPELTAFRSGLAFYGYNPFSEDSSNFAKAEALKPGLRAVSKIVSIQEIEALETVSYNGTYQASCSQKIATIPFGYYEGLSRNLSNLGEFVWETAGKRQYLKIAGKVCMNLCCLAAGPFNIKIGDEIEIISKNKNDKNSLENLSKLAGQIPYETLIRLQSNIHRIIN